MASCFACHSTGAAGAPKVGPGNAEAWAPRVAKGMDVLVTNAISGFNVMPPKGLCFTCTDDDLRAIVQYMVDSSK
ncbi:MAG: cytochrome c5 family protein [Pseudohongiella sp.]|nr:cytochrome c5 family protein [Pseudohongiella sp.]